MFARTFQNTYPNQKKDVNFKLQTRKINSIAGDFACLHYRHYNSKEANLPEILQHLYQLKFKMNGRSLIDFKSFMLAWSPNDEVPFSIRKWRRFEMLLYNCSISAELTSELPACKYSSRLPQCVDIPAHCFPNFSA
ncbi:hypothetical protein PsorP6_001458 [Peronosclerospora sorghi]|uniref:Uncharacterized protein n=1 Tax=Peronosclerospora sorghi TaxID=230839 RepID=A0ACC0WTI3_9STRA|nr:hypothetical protein PsorP6_001458 [Peronosclerospora sorghi]